MALPPHTNRYIAQQKQKRKSISDKSQAAVDSGDIQAVIDSLTPKQIRFCEEFLLDLNATKAVLRAGYQTKYPNRIAFQLMENQAIRLTIDALQAQRSQNSDVTKDFVLRGIQKAIRLAEESNNINSLLRGYELLARHLGMFVDRQEISGPDGSPIEHKKIEEDVTKFTDSIIKLSKRNTE
jgi:phage terminase small subunit